MGQKRVRYQWWRDIPRNVTSREYEQFQTRSFVAASLGLTAAVMAVVSILGLTLRPSQELAQIETLSIAEAVAATGDRPTPVKLEGYLIAEDSLAMPDDGARQVIRGRLTILARGAAGATTTVDEATNTVTTTSTVPQREKLFVWEETATRVFLSDGDRRIPLAFDLAVLPMREENVSGLLPKIVRQGSSARTSRPVAVQYGDQVFPLSPDIWGNADSVFADLERQVLPHGQTVVVVAKLTSTPTGNQLEDPLGDRLQVVLGGEDEIRQQGQHMRKLFGLLAIPLGLASFALGRSAYRLWQEFIERSNQ